MSRQREESRAIAKEVSRVRVTRDPVYRRVREHIRRAKDKYGKSIIELEKLLLRAPMLAMTNPLARKIKKEMEAHSVRKTTLTGEFFRARPIKKGNKFTSRQMTAPPLGWPHEGRFNHSGQNHLYLSTDEETCIREVLDSVKEGEHVCCIRWRLVQAVKNVLDLSYNLRDLGPSASTLLVALNAMHALERRHRNNLNWKPDYVLTRMIMDCAKETGFAGILYNSVRSDGKNVVLFNPATKLKVTRHPYCVDAAPYKRSKGRQFTGNLKERPAATK